MRACEGVREAAQPQFEITVNLLIDGRRARGDRGSVRVRPVDRAVRVVVRGLPVAARLVGVSGLRLEPRGHGDSLGRPGYRHVVRELPAGQDEEGLAPDHDVRVVGVVVHLPRLPQVAQGLRHLHHLLARVGRVFTVITISSFSQSAMILL